MTAKTVRLQEPADDGRVLIRQALTVAPQKVAELLTAQGVEIQPAGVNEKVIHDAIKVFREPVAGGIADILLEHDSAIGAKKDRNGLIGTIMGGVFTAAGGISTAIAQGKATTQATSTDTPSASEYLSIPTKPTTNNLWIWIGVAVGVLVLAVGVFYMMKNKGATKLK